MTHGQQLTVKGFRLVHCRFPNGSAYSFAYRRKSPLVCSVYYTFCSPKDPFSRPLAHRVLLGRAEKEKRELTFTLPEGFSGLKRTLQKEFEAMIIAGQLEAPNRIREGLLALQKKD